MDALQKAVLAMEILAERFGLDPIYLEALRTQSGDPFARLTQQNQAMADVLWEIAKGEMPSPPTPLPGGEGSKTGGEGSKTEGEGSKRRR
jgi:hypothetical protein